MEAVCMHMCACVRGRVSEGRWDRVHFRCSRCVSVAAIKHHPQKQLSEERVPFGYLWFQYGKSQSWKGA